MSHVYVIKAEGGPVKVGIANNPAARLDQLKTGTPFPLRLAYAEPVGDIQARKIEAVAHALLAAFRVHGEWFSVTVDEAHAAVLAAIEQLRNTALPEPACGMPKHPLRAWRDHQPDKMTQGQLAALVGPDTRQATISDIEAWRRLPSLELACRLEEITGLAPRQFLRPKFVP